MIGADGDNGAGNDAEKTDDAQTVGPGEELGQVDEPEKERRFVRIEMAVFKENEPIVAKDHLLGNKDVFQFVDRREIAEKQSRDKDHTRYDNDESYVSFSGIHAWCFFLFYSALEIIFLFFSPRNGG